MNSTITINVTDGVIQFTFVNSAYYLHGSGTIEVPVNSLSLVLDESDSVTFKKAASNDVFVSAPLSYFTDFSTKEDIMQYFEENMVGATGGGGSVDPAEVVSLIDEALTDYTLINSAATGTSVNVYTKAEVDAAYGQAISALNTKLDTAAFNVYSAATKTEIDAKANVSALTQNAYDTAEQGGTLDNNTLYVITDAVAVDIDDYYTKDEVDDLLDNVTITLDTAVTQNSTNAVEGGAIYAAISGKVEQTDYDTSMNVISQSLNDLNGRINEKVDLQTVLDNELVTAQALNLKQDKLYTITEEAETFLTVESEDIQAHTGNFILDSEDANEGLYGSISLSPFVTEMMAQNYNENTILAIDVDPAEQKIIMEAVTGNENDTENPIYRHTVGIDNVGIYFEREEKEYDTENQVWTQTVAGFNELSSESDGLYLNGDRIITQSDLDAAKSYYIDFNVLMTQGVTDDDWDGVVAAINAHRPIYAGLLGIYYCIEAVQVANNVATITASDHSYHYFYRITKNGSDDYTLTYETRPYITQSVIDDLTARITALENPTA